MRMGQRRWAWLGVLSLMLVALAFPASAQKAKKSGHTFDDLAFQKPELHLTAQVVAEDEARATSRAISLQDFDALLTREGVRWQLSADRMTGLPDTMGGQGIPWIPGAGTGNSLTRVQLGLKGDAGEIPVAFVAGKARDFIKRYPGLFGAPLDELSLNLDGSVSMLDYLYYIQFNWIYQGVPVENARVNFTLNHGNLIEVGQSYISPAIRKLSSRPSLDIETAWQILYGYLGESYPVSGDEVREQGRLLIVPVVQGDALQGTPSVPGEGLGYRLAWVIAFHREGVTGTWEARVDAHSGEILSFVDSNEYGTIKGGVYKTDHPLVEVNVPLPYANYSGTTSFADSAGNFPGTTGTSTLTGPGNPAVNNSLGGVNIVDACGAISKAADGAGLIDFGTSGSLDCTTPGTGGAGNTHAARTQFWNIMAIKQKAWTYLYSNGWLEGRLTDNVNINDTCNAYWNGTSVNFFRSGGGCWNTGELPGVSLHEWGHGMDSNDGGGGSPDNGSGETYGDITALLQTHNSCMGNGFSGRKCGYGADCLTCTGVRELDYAKYTNPVPLVGTMLNPWCPTSTTYRGPCLYEGHCESLISSQAVYDLAARDLITWGLDATTAWQVVDRLWYASRPTATAVYGCNTTTLATTGCNNGNLWRIFRAADDDDGNLNNGTPHMTALSAAFNRHLIACTSDAGYNTDSSACPSFPYLALTVQTSGNQNILTWNASAGATRYFVFRNDTSCEAGYTKIAEVTAPTATYTDASLPSGITLYYRVQAATTNCYGTMSNCASATTCTPPAAPTGLTATAVGSYQIDLAWGSVAGVTGYTVNRGTQNGGPYTWMGTTSSSVTAYSDTGLVSGTTYYYVVRALNGCESLYSAQANATAGGICNTPPTFAGLTSAANGLNATCQTVLNWSAGSSPCGGTISYNIYRARTAGYTPGPAFLLASGLSATTYTDLGAAYKTTYYYIVRASDSVSGLDDGNITARSNWATGPRTQIYGNDFESNGTGWTIGEIQTPSSSGTLSGQWLRGDPVGTINNYGSQGQPENAHGGTQCFFTGNALPTDGAGMNDVDNGEVWLRSPAFSAGTYPSVEVDLWRWFLNDHTATNAGCAYPDYYFMDVSNDGGTNWTTLETLDETCSTERNCGTNSWNNQKFLLENFVGLTSNMMVRFHAADGQNVVCAGDLVEAALDDFYVYGYTTCTACAAPPQPTGLLATAGANQVDLSWSASAGAAGYTLFRALGTCPGGTYTQIATGVTATSYADTGLSSGTAYSYKVLAYSASRCESPESACSNATPTGNCSLPPTFAGVATVVNSNSATCGIALTWAAATSQCGGALRYNVYRSTSSSFTPDSTTLLAKGLTTTSHSDTANLVYGTIYSYIVRAEDLSIAGPAPNGGTEETNTVTMASGPSGGAITGGTLFFDDFNRLTSSGIQGWYTGYFVGNANDWRGVQNCTAVTPPSPNIWRFGGTTCTANYAASVASLAAPAPDVYGFQAPFDVTNLRLTFYHRWQFSVNDGATLYLQKQSAAATYYQIPASAIVAGTAYNGITGAGNVLGAAIPAFTGTANNGQFYTTTVDLDAVCISISGTPCAGSMLGIAFVGSADTGTSGTNSDGWFIDNVTVTGNYGATSCTTAATCSIVVQLSPSTDSVLAGNDLLFSVSHTAGTAPYTYQWTEDGSDIAGATLSTLAVNKATAQSHTYNCKVTDQSGVCTDVTATTGATGTWTAAGGTASPVPASVTPMRIVKNNGTATDLNVTWDASNCASSDYHIIWGYGGNVATLNGASPVISGGKCDLGTGGALNNWTTGVPDPASDPGAGKFVWFLVVGDNNGTTEASWGKTTANTERGLTTPSSQCSCTAKDTGATCGTP